MPGLAFSALTPTGVAGVALIAHQGGWDEILLIAGPIAVIVGLLVLAKRRVDRIGGVDRRDRPD